MSDWVLFVEGASGTRAGESFALAGAVQVGPMTLRAVRAWHPQFSPANVIESVGIMNGVWRGGGAGRGAETLT